MGSLDLPFEPPDRPEQTGERGGYQAEVPRLLEAWADHEERWPAARQAATAERPADVPAEAIGQLRHGEPQISAAVRTAERENTSGGAWKASSSASRGKSDLGRKSPRGWRLPARTPARMK